MRAAILTVSDKGSRGEREDTGGPLLHQWLIERGVEVICTGIVADEPEQIAEALKAWADHDQPELILTTGGTGVSPRDVTPEATMQILDRQLPGFGELMRAESLKITPMAILSRAVAGIRSQSLIINLPGSPRGAIENLTFIWAAIPHTVSKLRGDTADCDGIGRQR